jgi:Polysaccharide biosynthesis protein
VSFLNTLVTEVAKLCLVPNMEIATTTEIRSNNLPAEAGFLPSWYAVYTCARHGSELALQLSKASPRALLLLDKDENGLNDTYSRLKGGTEAQTSAVVADLRFAERLRGVMETFRPEVVFHAAAISTFT